MMINSQTYEQYHQLFHDYLIKKFDDEQNEASLILESAEVIMPNTLNDYFGTHFSSIYDLQDINEVEAFRKKIKAHTILKSLDMQEEPRYTEVLKWYRLFLKSLVGSEAPLPVPGEYSAENDNGHSPMVSEPTDADVVQTTIFLEGEVGETLSVEHRQRNMELRQACIDFFRAKHNGHIVCECCGFDFAKAYDHGEGYIEVHHRFPFSHTEGEHPVDATKDLVPLCANCHRMIHYGQGGKGNCMSFDELKNKYKGLKY